MEEQVVSKLVEYGGMVTVLVLVILGMAWFIRILVNRNTALSDRSLEIVNKNTEALTEMKTMVFEIKEFLKEVVRNVR